MTADPVAATPAVIRLEGLSVYAHHGVVSEEQQLGQRFEFDVELHVDDCRACRTDSLDDSIAFEAVAAVVVEVAVGFRFALMEALADAMCTSLLEEFPASFVRIAASKVSPNIPYQLSRATIIVERRR